MLAKEEYLELFDDYLFDKKFPLKINLPKILVCHILGFLPKNSDIIDFEWYVKEDYKNHPFSLFDIANKKKCYVEEYNNWRNSFCINENGSPETQENFLNFKDVLKFASKNQRHIVIGESHDHSTPKAILMHNIRFLKENHAIVFLEGAFVELQEELNKSVYGTVKLANLV